jgi:hypothetical protein
LSLSSVPISPKRTFIQPTKPRWRSVTPKP